MSAAAYLARRIRRLLLDGTGRISQVRVDAKGCHVNPGEALGHEVPLVDDDLLYIRVGGLVPVRSRCRHGVDLRRQYSVSVRVTRRGRAIPVVLSRRGNLRCYTTTYESRDGGGGVCVVFDLHVAIHSSQGISPPPLAHFGNSPNIHFECCDVKKLPRARIWAGPSTTQEPCNETMMNMDL